MFTSKLKLLALVVGQLISLAVHAQEASDFSIQDVRVCNPSDCLELDATTKAEIEKNIVALMFNDSEDETQDDSNPSSSRLLIIPSNKSVKSVKDLKELIPHLKTKKKSGLSNEFFTSSSVFEAEATGNLMAFRMKPEVMKKYYFAANAFIAKSEKDRAFDELMMNSIGLGRAYAKNHAFEIGFMKLPSSGYTPDALKRPDGLILILYSKY